MFSTNIICSAAMVFVWTSPGLGQSFTYSQSSCVGSDPVTAFPNCNYLYDTIDKCSGPTVEGSANYISCMCNQELFNSYFGCDSEDRLCLGNSESDGSIEEGISQWHSICDGRTSTPITTPPVSSITASCDPDFYSKVNDACQSGQYSQQECHSSYPKQPVSFSSCFCEPALLSMDYTCLYLQNVSCFSTPAALTNLAGVYPYCTNLFQVLGSAPASSNATTTSENTYITVSFSPASSTAVLTSQTISPSPSQSTPGALSTSPPTSTGSSQMSVTASSTKSSSASLLNRPTTFTLLWGYCGLLLVLTFLH